ncbi:hypothetical protein T4D_7169 [Trichinella pseudospiralis]|uniref:Uncharacterized protein n=1 Tax=Trichinella pseudospiralis TaxID=6337 RepID=A0A0V1G5K9_TRIPS|nr:hypothetical protein T4D_7169 [Trichinella pseudospiralis]
MIIRVTPTQFIVYKLPGGKSSHYLLPNAAAAWTGAADIDAAQQPVHSTMNLYFASANKDRANIVAYSNYPPHFKFELPMSPGKDIYSNYVVKILKKTLQVYTPGTTTTVLRKSCAGTLKVENVLGPITVSDTVIPIEQDSARWSVPKSDIDFVCLSNTGRTADDAKHGATVACILSADATTLFRSMITTQNLDACPLLN